MVRTVTLESVREMVRTGTLESVREMVRTVTLESVREMARTGTSEIVKEMVRTGTSEIVREIARTVILETDRQDPDLTAIRARTAVAPYLIRIRHSETDRAVTTAVAQEITSENPGRVKALLPMPL